MDDMKNFLLEEGNSVMMGGDCSFNLGPFLVTFITYRHAMIKDCKSSKSPVMIGPALLHIRRTEQSYSYLGQRSAQSWLISSGLEQIEKRLYFKD